MKTRICPKSKELCTSLYCNGFLKCSREAFETLNRPPEPMTMAQEEETTLVFRDGDE
jgi:hypothetical protein